MPDTFDTLEHAIYEAAQAVRSKFDNRDEAITVIIEQDGKFKFLEPAARNPDTGEVAAKFTIPKGSLRHIVHNHPTGKKNEFFSDLDIRTSEQFGVPSAIIFGDDEPTITIFTLGKTKTRKSRVSGNTELRSRGDPFTFTPPTNEQFQSALDSAETKRDLTRAFNGTSE